MRSTNGSSFSFPSHLLFMLGGLLLGYSIAGLIIPDDPDVMRRVLTIVIGLSVLIVGRQTAVREGPRRRTDRSG